MLIINKILGFGLSVLLLLAVLVPTIYADDAPSVLPDNQTVNSSVTPSPEVSTVQVPDPSTAPDPTPSTEPSIAPEPSTSPSPEPSVSPSPTPSSPPSTDPSPTPSPSPSATPAPDSSPTPAPSSSPTPSPSPSPTPNTVVLNQTYSSPSNSNVSVKFTSLPDNPGSISFNEIQLSDSQKRAVGALSATAYDISSSMSNGTFTYDLILPIPAGANAQNLRIKFAQSVSDLGNAQDVTQSFTVNSDNTITVHGLNHFTVFVISGVNNSGSCSGASVTPPGGTTACYTTVQQAVDNAATGDTVNVSSGTYSENVNINKNLTITGIDTGGGVPTVTSFTLLFDPVNISGFSIATIIRVATPNITIASPVNSGNQTSVAININGLSGSTYNYTISDGVPAHNITGTGTLTGGNVNFNKDVTSLNEGALTLSIFLTDSLGHTSATATANSFKDTTSPAIPVVSFTTNPVNNANKTNVSINIVGESGATANYSITDGVHAAITGSGVIAGGTLAVNGINVSALNDGTLTLSATQTDSSGNVSSAGTNTVTKDTVAPNVSAGANKVTNIQFIQTGVASDNAPSSGIASYSWTKTAGPGTITFGTPNAVSTTVSANTDGVYTIQLTVVDVAGNSSSSTFSLTWDTTKPAVSANNVIAGWFTVNPTITLSVFDALSGLNNVRYAWDAVASAVSGTLFVNGTTINIPSDGVHTLNLYADDNATNSQPFSAVYRLDTQNPTVSATGSSASWQTTLPNITVSDSDTLPGSGVSTVTYQWDGGSLIATSNGANITASFPGDGIHSLDLLVTDVSGRTGTFHGTYMIDRVNPTNPGTPATVTPTNSTTQVWNFAVSTDATSGIAQYVWRTMLGVTVGPSGTAPANASSVTTNLTEGVWTFFIKAVDVAGNQSNEVSANVMVDTTKPTTTDAGTDSLWHKNPVDVALTCSDNLSGCVQLIYTTDGSDPTISGTRTIVNSDHTTIHLSLEGVYTIKYYSLDAAGNQEATKLAANQVKIDTTLPIVFSDNVIAGWFQVNPTITLSASDLGGSQLNNVRYNWDAPATAVSGTVFVNGTQINIPGEGIHTLNIYADDNAGNQSLAYSATYRLDTVDPQISATGSSAGWQTSVPTITVSATDTLPGSDVASVQYSWDGGAFNATSNGADLTASLQALGDGIHTLTINITDVSGRTNQFVGTYMIDTVNPATSDDTDNLWHNVPVTIHLTCFDATSGCQKITYTTDGSDPTASATAVMVLGNTANIILNSDGVYTIRYLSNDVAGNTEGVQTAANHVMIDQTIPVISGVNLANVTTGNSAYIKDGDIVTLTATVTDLNNQNLLTTSMITADLSAIGGGVSVNPISYDNLTGLATWANIVVSGSGNGVITINVDANDVANNPAIQQNITSTADNINPVTTDDVDGLWHNAAVTVHLNCNDVNNCAQTYYTTDGSTPTLASATGTSILLNVDGVYTIKYFSVDNAGNTEAVKTAVNQVMIDLTAPVISGVTFQNTSTGNNAYVKNGDTIFITATITDNNQVLLTTGMITADLSSLGGGASVNPISYNSATGLATWANLVVSGLGNGILTITVNANDVANNPAAAQNVTTIADTIAPQTTDNAPAGWNKISVTVTLTCTDATSLCQTTYYTTDGSDPLVSPTVQTGNSILLSASGVYTIKYYSIDNAGNVEAVKTAANQVMIDKAIPVISNVVLGNFVKNGDTVSLTATITDNNQALLTAGMITADLSGLGGGASINPISYNSATGLATWAPLLVSGTGNGIVIITVSSLDIAGNLAVPAAITTTADNTNPTGTWSQPVANSNVSGTVNLSATVSDNLSGVASVAFQYAGADNIFHNIATVNNPTSPVSTTWDTSALALDFYTLRLVITDSAGNSINVDQTVGLATVITPPQTAATASSANSITITWITANPTTSRVIYDTISHPVLGSAPNYGYANSTVESDLGKVTSHAVTLSGLSASTNYYYRMVSKGSPEAVSAEFSFKTNDASAGPGGGGSNVGGSCDNTKPSIPKLLSALANAFNQIVLTWSKSTGPVGYYLITYGLSSGAQQFGNPNVGGPETTSYTVGGLQNGVTYYFKVRAGNGCVPGDFSNELSAKALGQTLTTSAPAEGFKAGILGEKVSATSLTESLATQSASETPTPEPYKVAPIPQGPKGLPLPLVIVLIIGGVLFFILRI